MTEFAALCELLPEGVNWSDPISPAIAATIADRAAAKEREACAKVCDARAERRAAQADMTDDEDDRTDLKANAWQFSVLGAEIRKRSNELT